MNYVAILLITLHIGTTATMGCNDTTGSEGSDTESDSDTMLVDDSESDSESDIDTEVPVNFMDIPADNENIQYAGRIDFSDPAAPSFAFPGISIKIKFTGRAIGMRLTDAGSTVTSNYYGVIVDDGELVEIEVSPDVEVYELANDLADGEHTVEVFKLGEAAPGGCQG